MSSAMMLERSGVGVQGLGAGAAQGLGGQAGVQPTANWLMVPRGGIKLEKCSGGLKITCGCDDKTAASMVQNLCAMLAGGMCSCCVMMNGMTVCCCNLTMGLCKVESTERGVCILCTSGDQQWCEGI